MPATIPDPAPAARSRSSIRSLLRLWPYVRPIRGRLAASAVVGVVASSMGLLIPLVLKWLVDGPVTDQDPSGVWLGGGVVLLLGLLEAVLFGLRRWLVARPLAGVEASMRADLYQRLQRLPVAFHDRWASGQLLSRATTDLQILRMFLAFPLVFLFVNSTTMLVGFGILLAQSPLLTLVLLVPAVPLMVLSSRFEKQYALAARRAQDQAGDLATLVEESVLGIRIIKAFGRHRSQSQAFHRQARDLRGTELHKARLLSDLWAIIMTLPEVAIGVALVVGVLQVSDDKLSAGTLVAFLTTALALRWPVESIGFLLAMSNEAATAADRYFEPMTTAGAEGTADPATPAARPGAAGAHSPAPRPAATGTTADTGTQRGTGTPTPRPAATDTTADTGTQRGTGTPTPRPAATGTGTGTGTSADADHAGTGRPAHTAANDAADAGSERRAGSAARADRGAARGDGLRMEGVGFRYPDAPAESRELLSGVDLHVRSGETMALVGATGCGKTTLTALVPRLHEVTGGRITLDGVDTAGMPVAGLRTLVAVAFEEPTLFSASVRENVAMGAGPDGAGEAEVLRALEIAQCAFVHALPDGLDTQVGEQGLSLSGGQRQRLALARAVVGRPQFLILDDPLSALDVHTEALVEAALRDVLRETTALVVAHRPSTVQLADRVALLSCGRITAVGTHHELLRDNAEYRRLMSGLEAAAEPLERSDAR